jgi:hypothetical protein
MGNNKILISHRGNLNGPNIKLENNPEYVCEAYKKGYHVEIDVWKIKSKWYLGHNRAQYGPINYDFLLKPKLWLHAKNGDAFYHLIKNKCVNVFWHTTEDWILTSRGFIWTHPKKMLYPDSICVMPENGYTGKIKKCYGICSDFISSYKL